MSTPLMAQYYKIKESRPDTILLFRIGDFFETFEEDAKIASKTLGIVLTKRANGAAGEVPLAGFPHHAIDAYLPKLVRAGYRVAICEQMENPKFAKGIVKREIVEVVTPGVALSDKLLDHKKNNFLMSIYIEDAFAGISFCDISTGDFYAYEIPDRLLRRQIESINPSEIVCQKKHKETIITEVQKSGASSTITKLDDWIFDINYAKDALTEKFNSINLKGFGIESLRRGTIAAGAILNYLEDTQKTRLEHLTKISRYNHTDYMQLDVSTKRNLEILYSLNDGGKEGTLISILDKTETPMGARTLKNWISAPLIKLEPISNRLNAVEELYNHPDICKKTTENLKDVGDIERIISKICAGKAAPRDLIALKNSLKKIPKLKELLTLFKTKYLTEIRDNLESLDKLTEAIEISIDDNPPANISDGGVIKQGYSVELDELRDLSKNAKDWIANLQKSERERSNIPSLKVNYNRVFGYYIEITNAHKDKIPDNYIRKQTLVNSERYITPELKEYEDKILHAEEKTIQLESQLFDEIRKKAAVETEKIQKNAKLISALDCLLSFSICAREYSYVKPELDESDEIEIIQGRHPVVERILKPGEKFTPNDLILNSTDCQIIMLTGPNMAGKSVYLRQTGLIVLLAQIGSFVPAQKAKIGLVDNIFTRVGASDNISAGESTFLVEMQEAANILNNATNKSLILLDEIGRGTSTFDGISIAWSITEYLHENPELTAKTLFATHYHELNEMASIFPRIKNFKVEVREYSDKVIFLHKVSPGGADHSYGIQVAQMAGLPEFITLRAKEILHNLEGKELTPMEIKKQKLEKFNKNAADQFNLFEIKDDKIRTEISNLKIDELTPIEALNKLNELKKQVKDN